MGLSSSCISFPNIIKAGAKFLCRGAAFELSPAFQSRESGYAVVSVAERRLIQIIGVNRRSATENGYALVDPALKSRAKLTWSLRDREKGDCIIFSKAISRYYVGYLQCLMAPQRDMNAHQKRDRIYRIYRILHI